MKTVVGRMREEVLIERQVTVEVPDDASEIDILDAIKEAALNEQPNFHPWDVLQEWDPEICRWYFIDEINGVAVGDNESLGDI